MVSDDWLALRRRHARLPQADMYDCADTHDCGKPVAKGTPP